MLLRAENGHPKRSGRDHICGDVLHDRFDLGRFVGLPKCETGVERDAIAIAEQMDFGTEAAHRTAKRVVTGFGVAVRPALFRASREAVSTDDCTIQ